MNKNGDFNSSRIRLICFVLVTVLHVLLIMFAAFRMEIAARSEEPAAGVMKLVDIQEAPPPPQEPPPMPQSTTQEPIAQTMIEVDEEPVPAAAPYQPPAVTEQIQYLRQDQVSVIPILPEDEIIRATVYPLIAQRSNIEGIVYLELFIDHYGNVRNVQILREDPPNRGFGEAAVNAFRGIRGTPAQANGVPVAVRFRVPFRFRLN